jgi:hypothetical protein
MKATVVNLNSTFDWRKDVAAILDPLDGTGIASALGVPDAEGAINDCLLRLRWIFLISDLTLEAQVRANPHGEGSEPERPQREFPFCQRRGGRQGESRFYRQPRSASGGGVVEPLGIYTRDVRAFAGQAPLKPSSTRSVEQSSEGPTLESLLPDEADGPAVILCPERLFELPYELVRSLERQEPHPASQLNLSDLFLRMTLIHEIGHHVLPVPASERAGASRHIHVSEALANTFCNALLDPGERQWLFAKAWLLQPTAYLGYFVPHILEKLEPSAQFADEWKNVVRNSLGMTPDDHDRCHFDEIPSFRSKPFVGSPQMHWATSGLLQALSLIPPEPFLPDCEPCAIGPFEEFDMPWATEPGLLRLLQHPERSVQTEAFRSLVRADDRQPETDQALARWCDAHIGSDYLQEAEVAWNSPFAHRDEGRLDRYRKVAASPHEIIVADLPEKARRHCSEEDGRPIIECLLDDSRLEVRLAAVRELAELFYDTGDVVDLEKLVLNRPHRGVTRAKAAELPVDLMFLLAVWEHPLRDNIGWSAPFLCDLATKQVEALQGNEAAARKERVASEARKLLLGNRVAWGGRSAVAMVFSKAAKCDDMRSLLPKLVECGFKALQPDQGRLVEDLLFGKTRGPLPLRLALIRTLKARGLYDARLALRLLKSDHRDDPKYEVATWMVRDGVETHGGRLPYELAVGVATGINETDGPGYALRERAAKAIVDWWTQDGPSRLSAIQQIASFKYLLTQEYVAATLNVVLPAVLPGWPPQEVRDVLTEMAQHTNEWVRQSAAHHLHQRDLIDAELLRRLLLDPKIRVTEQVWRDQMRWSECRKKCESSIPVDLLIEAAKGSLPSFRDKDATAREMKEPMKKMREEALQCLHTSFPLLAGEERASDTIPFEVAARVATGFDQADGPGFALAEQAARAIVKWWTQAGPGQLSPAEQVTRLWELLNQGRVAAVLNVVFPALLPGWSPVEVRDVLTEMVQHTNEWVRRSAAHHLRQNGLIDAELLRRLLLDPKFLVTEQVWRERCESDVPVDLLVEAAKGSLPSFQDRGADARRMTEIQKEAVECLRNKLPSLSAEERPAVEAVLHDVERRTQAEAQAKAYRGETCPRCRSSFGWGSKCKHCGFPLQ